MVTLSLNKGNGGGSTPTPTEINLTSSERSIKINHSNDEYNINVNSVISSPTNYSLENGARFIFVPEFEDELRQDNISLCVHNKNGQKFILDVMPYYSFGVTGHNKISFNYVGDVSNIQLKYNVYSDEDDNYQVEIFLKHDYATNNNLAVKHGLIIETLTDKQNVVATLNPNLTLNPELSRDWHYLSEYDCDVIKATYEELRFLATVGGLQKGKKYELTDYTPTFNGDFEKNGVTVQPTEDITNIPLILTAIDRFHFDENAEVNLPLNEVNKITNVKYSLNNIYFDENNDFFFPKEILFTISIIGQIPLILINTSSIKQEQPTQLIFKVLLNDIDSQYYVKAYNIDTNNDTFSFSIIDAITNEIMESGDDIMLEAISIFQAGTENATGFIYYMEDDRKNCCDYDFLNLDSIVLNTFNNTRSLNKTFGNDFKYNDYRNNLIKDSIGIYLFDCKFCQITNSDNIMLNMSNNIKINNSSEIYLYQIME